MLVPLQLLWKEREEVQSKLLLKSLPHWLLTKLVKELMGKGLGSVEPVFGRVYHDLG